MWVRVAVGGSTGGKSLFAQISINTPQPLGSKNRSIRICFGIRAATSNGNLRQVRKIDRAGGSALQCVGHPFPKELSADVGALRGTANNLAASVGTVVIGALVVSVLSTGVINALTAKLLAFWTRSNTHAECKM
jgi:hypothetical protein